MESNWLLVLLAPIGPVLVGYLLSRRKIEQIHILVNSRLEDALAHIARLEQALTESQAE